MNRQYIKINNNVYKYNIINKNKVSLSKLAVKSKIINTIDDMFGTCEIIYDIDKFTDITYII
jgi:hypothetical protein